MTVDRSGVARFADTHASAERICLASLLALWSALLCAFTPCALTTALRGGAFVLVPCAFSDARQPPRATSHESNERERALTER